ncbi:uncharacterized protein LOC120619317 [Pteropus medius]|uniref:uncharacterized protein LOC120619317 n=1 Tax=Pteropus vampyrus TaxID=132908 RepID=UPI00196B9BAE|nr:uncharacterized protein LOC120619317 [Pteropus giganteus]
MGSSPDRIRRVEQTVSDSIREEKPKNQRRAFSGRAVVTVRHASATILVLTSSIPRPSTLPETSRWFCWCGAEEQSLAPGGMVGGSSSSVMGEAPGARPRVTLRSGVTALLLTHGDPAPAPGRPGRSPCSAPGDEAAAAVTPSESDLGQISDQPITETRGSSIATPGDRPAKAEEITLCLQRRAQLRPKTRPRLRYKSKPEALEGPRPTPRLRRRISTPCKNFSRRVCRGSTRDPQAPMSKDSLTRGVGRCPVSDVAFRLHARLQHLELNPVVRVLPSRERELTTPLSVYRHSANPTDSSGGGSLSASQA